MDPAMASCIECLCVFLINNLKHTGDLAWERRAPGISQSTKQTCLYSHAMPSSQDKHALTGANRAANGYRDNIETKDYLVLINKSFHFLYTH